MNQDGKSKWERKRKKVKERETIYFWVIIMLTFDDTHIFEKEREKRMRERKESGPMKLISKKSSKVNQKQLERVIEEIP